MNNPSPLAALVKLVPPAPDSARARPDAPQRAESIRPADPGMMGDTKQPAPTDRSEPEKSEPFDPTGTIHVITHTGSGRFDAILSGCVGHLDEVGRFHLDPDYAKLSHLFTLASRSSLQAVGCDDHTVEPSQANTSAAIFTNSRERTMAITMPQSALFALKTNLIGLCAQRWDGMYDSVATTVPEGTLAATMLQVERQSVSRAVHAHLSASALPEWSVPVTFQADVLEEDPQIRSRCSNGLLLQAGRPLSITPDITREPGATDRGLATAATADTNAHITEQPQPSTAAWVDHVGPLSLTIEAEMRVRASSPEQAWQVTDAMLSVAREIPGLWAQLRPTAQSIRAVQLGLPMDQDPDGDRNTTLGHDRCH